jgi:hypothetical protein
MMVVLVTIMWLWFQCIESLLTLQNKIVAAVAGKKRLPQVYENCKLT